MTTDTVTEIFFKLTTDTAVGRARDGKQTGAPWRPLTLRNRITVVKIQKHKKPVVKSRGLCKRDPKPAKSVATVLWVWPRMVP